MAHRMLNPRRDGETDAQMGKVTRLVRTSRADFGPRAVVPTQPRGERGPGTWTQGVSQRPGSITGKGCGAGVSPAADLASGPWQ